MENYFFFNISNNLNNLRKLKLECKLEKKSINNKRINSIKKADDIYNNNVNIVLETENNKYIIFFVVYL